MPLRSTEALLLETLRTGEVATGWQAMQHHHSGRFLLPFPPYAPIPVVKAVVPYHWYLSVVISYCKYNGCSAQRCSVLLVHGQIICLSVCFVVFFKLFHCILWAGSPLLCKAAVKCCCVRMVESDIYLAFAMYRYDYTRFKAWRIRPSIVRTKVLNLLLDLAPSQKRIVYLNKKL